MNAVKRSASSEVVALLWTNLFGSGPTVDEAAIYVAMLDKREISIGGLTVLAANTTFNTNNINLVGLSQTGLDYI